MYVAMHPELCAKHHTWRQKHTYKTQKLFWLTHIFFGKKKVVSHEAFRGNATAREGMFVCVLFGASRSVYFCI